MCTLERPLDHVFNVGSAEAGDSDEPGLAISALEKFVGEGALEVKGLASTFCPSSEIRSSDLRLLMEDFGACLAFVGRRSLRPFIVAFGLDLDFLINLDLNLESLV
jgi:hypothetical protein